MIGCVSGAGARRSTASSFVLQSLTNRMSSSGQKTRALGGIPLPRGGWTFDAGDSDSERVTEEDGKCSQAQLTFLPSPFRFGNAVDSRCPDRFSGRRAFFYCTNILLLDLRSSSPS